MRFRQNNRYGFRQAVKRRGSVFAAGLVSVSILACSPVIDNRGYFFDNRSIADIEKGVTDQTPCAHIRITYQHQQIKQWRFLLYSQPLCDRKLPRI